MGFTVITYQLTEFNLKDGEQIDLGNFCGLIKIARSRDGKLILMTDGEYGIIDHTKPTPATIASMDDLLAFNLDIGIRREKELTYSNGLYLGENLTQGQSHKLVGQKDFDLPLLQNAQKQIQTLYQSLDPKDISEAVRLAHLFKVYNHARLQYPDFIDESYLGLMRILDALPNLRQKTIQFALSVSRISPELNREIYDKVMAVEGLRDRLKIANEVCKHVSKLNKDKFAAEIAALTEADKFIFACFYSAYEYRSKFVHLGFPFPYFVKEALYLEEESGMAYISPTQGESHVKTSRPGGLTDGDLVDIHCVISDPDEEKRFREWYFKLLPTWYFVKRVARAGVIEKIKDKM
ncbi:MAG: hypothetical protein PHC70_02115 [Patescibacteria group bacterium]|nr:hypothetical protein [Patescibacteria group bacterium]